MNIYITEHFGATKYGEQHLNTFCIFFCVFFVVVFVPELVKGGSKSRSSEPESASSNSISSVSLDVSRLVLEDGVVANLFLQLLNL